MSAKLRLHAAPATLVSLAVILALLPLASSPEQRLDGEVESLRTRRSAPAASPQRSAATRSPPTRPSTRTSSTAPTTAS